jgi:hypothetical protein
MSENVRITLFDRGIFSLLIKRGTRLKIKSVGSSMKHDCFKKDIIRVRHSVDKITFLYLYFAGWQQKEQNNFLLWNQNGHVCEKNQTYLKKTEIF